MADDTSFDSGHNIEKLILTQIRAHFFCQRPAERRVFIPAQLGSPRIFGVEMIVPGSAMEQFSGFRHLDSFQYGFSHSGAALLFLGEDGDKPLGEPSWRGLKGELNRDDLQKFSEPVKRELPVGFFAPAQAHVYPHLVAVRQELCDLFCAQRQIMRTGGKSYPDTFELRLFLFLAVLALAFFPFVLELAEIHNPAYRRIGSRGYFNEIQSLLLRHAPRLGKVKHAEVFTVRPDHADGRGADPLIDAVASLDKIEKLTIRTLF